MLCSDCTHAAPCPLVTDVLNAARERGIDPCTQAFKPLELHLQSERYGSFSDHCAESESGQNWQPGHHCLKVAEWRKDGRPLRYLLRC